MKNPVAFGPMSPEIVEAVFRYSHVTHYPLMLIASKNQVDYAGGYVNNWNTQTYMSFVKEMRSTYLDADVLVCRDHCGPGFNGNTELSDTFKTINEDIRRGFDLIHIDFCHFPGPRANALEKAAEAINFAKRLNPTIRFEIGTDEIRQPFNLPQARRDVEFFLQFCKPDYYVVNTGSHVLEDKQVGVFNSNNVQLAKDMLFSYGLKLKEHNADYLTPDQIKLRNGLVDSMNIAPELGVRQTERVISLANQYHVDYEAFLETAYKSKKWKKWLHLTSPDDRYSCAIFAGHYCFTSKEYKRLCTHLNEHIDLKEELIKTAIEVIDRYVVNRNG
jgi:hypothetical protein